MSVATQQTETDFRCEIRCPVDCYVTGDHRHLGRLILKISNLSTTGAMVDGRAGIERGDIVLLRLTGTRDVEALCLWTWHQQAGLQFTQPISFSELLSIIGAMNLLKV